MTALVLLLGLLTGPALAGPYRAVRRATAEADSARLLRFLDHSRAYVREHAALGLRPLPPSEPARAALRSCLQSVEERDWVRAACGGTLARWGDTDAVTDLVVALDQVGPEARYWLAEALSHLDHPEARATLVSLQGSDDLLLATAAREWAP
jgi:HEAT repeat protein